MVTTIVQVGNEAAVIIPNEIIEKLGLHIGDDVDVEYDANNRRIIVEKIEKNNPHALLT